MTKIFKRTYKSGTVVYTVTSGDGPNRIRKTLGPDKRLAEAYAGKIRLDGMKEKLGLATNAPDLKTCLNLYLESANTDLKKRSFIRYREYCNHFFTFLKEKHPEVDQLEDIKPPILEEYKTHRLRLKKAEKTVKSELEGLSTFFKWAIRMGYTLDNPVTKIRKPKPYAKLPRVYTPQELTIIFRNAGPRLPFYRTLYHTGFRLTEALAIRVKDINLGENFLVYHNLKAKRDEHMEISKILRPILENLVRGKKPEDPIFSFPQQGTSLTNGLLLNFQATLKRLKIPHGTLHDFKHTFVTHLLNDGVPPTVVQLLAHHKSLSTTLKYYRGPTQEQIRGAVNRLPV